VVESERRNNLQADGCKRRKISKWWGTRREIICKWRGARDEYLVNGGAREEK
jgi:hypothetical protein